MPLTIRKVPQELQPTYNQVIIAATSSLQTELNYQLVSDVYCRGQKVSRMKTPVNPEGYIVVDYHKHLENRVSFDFLITATGFSVATQSFASYSVVFFDEFRHEWDFTDNQFSPIGLTSYAGFISQQTPYFSVGDEVYISQNAGYTHPEYNGVHNIIAITQSGLTWSITTDAPWQGSSPANPGTMVYSSFQLTTLPVGTLTLFSTPTQSSTASFFPEKYVFNGVEGYVDFISWNYDEYDANTSTLGKFFTNAPDNYVLATSSNMLLNLYQNATDEITSFKVSTNLGTFSIVNSFTTITNDQHRFLQINASPKLFYQSGWINNSTTSITMWVENKTADKTIANKTFSIGKGCSPYDDLEIIFMDRLGSFIPYVFNRLNRQTNNIQRSDYQQVYGSYAPASQNWNYNTYDRGRKSLDVVVSETYTATSDWVNQATSDYLQELFQSPEVYLVKPDGTIVAINLTVSSMERKQTINEQVVNYTITFELSNKNMNQRG
jgi:hypothetical protein